MQYSHLLNRWSTKRCIKALLKHLADARVLGKYQETVQALVEKPGSLTFPGFNMLMPAAPYQLFVPAPTCDIPDFLNIYEEFADRPLGQETRAGRAASGVYSGSGEGVKIMTFFKDHDQWRSPALLLLAAARHIGGEVETVTDSTARVRLGTGILEVTQGGCYSNFRKSVYACHRASGHVPATVFRAATTRHPALVALDTVMEELSYSVTYIGTALALALQVGEITHDDLLTALQGSPAKGVRLFSAGPKGTDAAEQILRVQSVGVVHSLYGALVPGTMSSREFRKKFGSPHRAAHDQVTRPATRQRWLELLS